MSTILATALAFARHGHAVFPVNWPVERDGRLVCSCGGDSRGQPCKNAAKHPYGKLAPRGLLSATTDSGILLVWVCRARCQSRRHDRSACCCDPRHGGDESFRALEREQGELPLTCRVLSGGGGEHILFAAPDGADIANVAKIMDDPPLGRGIDIRARSAPSFG